MFHRKWYQRVLQVVKLCVTLKWATYLDALPGTFKFHILQIVTVWFLRSIPTLVNALLTIRYAFSSRVDKLLFQKEQSDTYSVLLAQDLVCAKAVFSTAGCKETQPNREVAECVLQWTLIHLSTLNVNINTDACCWYVGHCN